MPTIGQSHWVWRGQSPADGSDIVVIATNLRRKSENRKTGHMVQVYILSATEMPVEAATSGRDVGTCGQCPFKPSLGGVVKCYVNTGWLQKLWLKWKRGDMSYATPESIGDYARETGQPIRDGAYGDPGMIPFEVWDAMRTLISTSYTHQWAESWIDTRHAELSMASVGDVHEKRQAVEMGWRTYRVLGKGDALDNDEILCPHPTVQCADCGLCAGNSRPAKNIAVAAIK